MRAMRAMRTVGKLFALIGTIHRPTGTGTGITVAGFALKQCSEAVLWMKIRDRCGGMEIIKRPFLLGLRVRVTYHSYPLIRPRFSRPRDNCDPKGSTAKPAKGG